MACSQCESGMLQQRVAADKQTQWTSPAERRRTRGMNIGLGVLGVQRRVLENFATGRLKAKKIMNDAFLEERGIEWKADRGRSITSPDAKNQEQR